MREKEGTAIIHVLGTADTPEGFPVSLVGAHVEIHKVADTVADADEPSGSKGRAKKPAPPRDDCVATGTTGSDGSRQFRLGEGDYRARATFGSEHGWSDRFHVCEGDTADVTAEVPLPGFTVTTSQTHCREDYTEHDLCHLRSKRPIYVLFTWGPDVVDQVAFAASGATVKSLRPPAGASGGQREAYYALTPIGAEVLMRVGASNADGPVILPIGK